MHAYYDRLREMVRTVALDKEIFLIAAVDFYKELDTQNKSAFLDTIQAAISKSDIQRTVAILQSLNTLITSSA
jgi:hypothetical protein